MTGCPDCGRLLCNRPTCLFLSPLFAALPGAATQPPRNSTLAVDRPALIPRTRRVVRGGCAPSDQCNPHGIPRPT